MTTRPSDATSYGEWLQLTRERDHTPTPIKHRWQAGDLCLIDGKHLQREKGRMYEAKVLETAFSSKGDYLQIKLEVTATVKAFGQTIQQTWIHPKPVQSYKLRKPLLKGDV